MDSLIISGVTIYFPKLGEILPVPPDNMPSFAVKGTSDKRWCLLACVNKKWHVMELPEYNHTGSAIMEAARLVKIISCRYKRDAALIPEIQRVYEENYSVYSVCKVSGGS